MPSAADLIFLVLLATLSFSALSTRLLGDAGTGWHIRTGQLIVTGRGIPHTDPFSSTMQGKPWFAWEWLYDVVLGSLDSCCGLNGVVWLTALLIAIVFSATFHLLVARGTNLIIAFVLTLLAISASTIHFLARPHVVSWLLVLVWFWALDSTQRATVELRSLRAWRIWCLPITMLIWANLHGGFLLGFLLLAIFWVDSLRTWFLTKPTRIEGAFEKIAAARRTRTLTWIGLLALAASFVNPYGWKLHAHIYSYLTNRFLMDHIEEFQSPNFHGLAERCFLFLLLVTLATVGARATKLRLSEILLLLLAVYAGLSSSRNIPVASILLVLIVGPFLPALAFSGFAKKMTGVDSRLRRHLWPILATLVTLLSACSGGPTASTQWMNAHFDPERMPVAAVNAIEKSGWSGPVLAPDYWGGYLIYRLYPKTRVVIDDRHDLYGSEILKSYLRMIRGEPDFDEFVHQHPAETAVLPTKSALAVILGQSREWTVVYSDPWATVFVRVG